MKCYHYQIINRKTGKVVVDNYGWASSFEALQKANGHGNIFKVVEIK